MIGGGAEGIKDLFGGRFHLGGDERAHFHFCEEDLVSFCSRAAIFVENRSCSCREELLSLKIFVEFTSLGTFLVRGNSNAEEEEKFLRENVFNVLNVISRIDETGPGRRRKREQGYGETRSIRIAYRRGSFPRNNNNDHKSQQTSDDSCHLHKRFFSV